MPRIATDLTGKTFGWWTVLHLTKNTNKSRHAYWLCRCTCGAEVAVSGPSLRNGASTKCRTCSYRLHPQRRDVVGKRYGKWTVLADAGYINRTRYALCICECGTERRVTVPNLISGRSVQCRTCANRSRKNHEGEVS